MTTSAADRMRRMRERRRAHDTAPLLFERSDWKLFLDAHTLPQKAGCEPNQIGRAIVKELVDNALDTGAGEVTVTGDARHCTVADNGPGLSEQDMLRVFAVNRPLVSSKYVRLPTRGMLGNGLRVVMGAVAAFNGTLTVTTRGTRYETATDSVTGSTQLVSSRPARPAPGLAVALSFPGNVFTDGDFVAAQSAINLARDGTHYDGFSEPGWYSPQALCDLLAAAPKGTKPGKVVEEVFDIGGETPDTAVAWAEQFIAEHPAPARLDIGDIGEEALDGYYRKVASQTVIDDAVIPFCVEVWVTAETMDRNEDVSCSFHPLLNRSPTLATMFAYADSTGLHVYGCGIDVKLSGPKRAWYGVDLSLITPYLRLTGDGKAPYLGHFQPAIEKALKGAAGEAYRNLVRPKGRTTIKDAAYAVMADAYMTASDNPGGDPLPVKARQIMYQARPEILELTGNRNLRSNYFTQTLLPAYVQDYPDETADWDVVYDARGHFNEPHTGRSVPLGTLEVRQFLGERPSRRKRPHLQTNGLYPTSGPLNRFRNILFVEKEGFDELFAAVQLAERYDIAIMSTKGMSVVASRLLIDRLAPLVDHIFALHDFDISGFSIFGTLGTDSDRYVFANDMSAKLIDIGLHLEDAEAMGLASEPVKVEKDRDAVRETLARHGATDEEIEFLVPQDEDEPCRRVELNAMTSRQLVDFVEAAFMRHGVGKVMPDNAVIRDHARHLLESRLSAELLAQHADDIAAQAAAVELPVDLFEQILDLVSEEPELSWDEALARLL
jgi:hypothetical protein